MKSVMTCSIDMASRAILACIKTKTDKQRALVPVLVGPPGCGKTEAIFAVAAQLKALLGEDKFQFSYRTTAHDEPSDMAVPYKTEQGKLGHIVAEWLPTDAGVTRLVALDELDRTGMQTQNAYLQILHGGYIHGHRIAENVFFVAAMNGSTDTGTTALNGAIRNRVVFLYVDPKRADFAEGWQDWAAEADISPEVRAFAQNHPEALQSGGDYEFEDLAYPSARSTENVDRLRKACANAKFRTDDIEDVLIQGVVGNELAVKWRAHKMLVAKAPPLADILKDPTGVSLPDDVGVLYTLCMMVTDHCKSNVTDAKKVLAFIGRLPDEVAAHAARRLAKRVPAVVGTPEFIKFAGKVNYLLT